MPLTPAQVHDADRLGHGGGKLIAMRPDKKLATLLGLASAQPTLATPT